MNVSIGERWEAFVTEAVRSGRYGSASEVVREGLRLLEERDAKLAELGRTLDASMAEGLRVEEGDIDAALATRAAEIRAAGEG